MGTSGSYTGAGGAAGADMSEGLGSWLDALPASDGSTEPKPDGQSGPTNLPQQVVSGALGLLRPSSGRGSGSGGMGSGGGTGSGGGGSAGGGRAGSSRSATRMSAAGGRAAAGAYAYVSGNAAGLADLGLDYDSLRALGDPIEVTRRIVGAVCGERSTSTLEESEERYVAANVAEWVLNEAESGVPPDVDEIARHAIATILAELISSELGAALADRPNEIAAVAEDELRDAAGVIASKATLSVAGASESELVSAIEAGIDTLRDIYGGDKS